MKESKKEVAEIEHLKHMETAIFTLLVAVSILGFNLYIKYVGAIDNYIDSLLTYIFGFPLVLFIFHLYHLILGKIRPRLVMFFVDAIILITVGFVSILFFISSILSKFFPSLFEKLLITVVGGFIIFIISLFLLYKKIIPAFEKDIFPTLCRKYKIPKFQYKTQKKRNLWKRLKNN